MTLKQARKQHEIAVHNGPHIVNDDGELEPIRLTGMHYSDASGPYLTAYGVHGGLFPVHERDIVYRWPRMKEVA